MTTNETRTYGITQYHRTNGKTRRVYVDQEHKGDLERVKVEARISAQTQPAWIRTEVVDTDGRVYARFQRGDESAKNARAAYMEFVAASETK